MTSASGPPSQFWARAVPALARHVVRTMPWVVLIAGCASGTVVLALLARFAGPSPISQGTVRVTLLPAVAALAFLPHAYFRPVTQATPVPTWIVPTGQLLLALPVVAVTCWAQLRLMVGTYPAGFDGHLPAAYPLLAQLTGWSAITLALAASCERTRYADLSGAIAVPISFAVIALTTFTPPIERHLLTPPASPHAATIAWYAIAAAALAVAGVAIRDQWQRYTRSVRV